MILDAEIAKQRRDIGGRSIAHAIAKLRKIAGANGGGELVGGPGSLPDRLERRFARGSSKFFGHFRQSGSYDIVMVNM